MYFDIKTQEKLGKLKVKLLNKAFFKDNINSFKEITTLSKLEREYLDSNIDFFNFTIEKILVDKESGTYKALLKTRSNKLIETVLMRFKDGRNSVCVSSQVGCPVGCIFCASGQMGFQQNLSAQEIVDQVLFWSRFINNPLNYTKYFVDHLDNTFSYPLEDSNEENERNKNNTRITNVVYMGMGEPMLNYVNVIESLKILTNPEEIGLGDRHITLSSSGYVKQLNTLLNENIKVRLAISLHAPNQKLREQLMPVAKIYPLDQLFEFISAWEKKSKKRISYEYTMIDDINDTTKHAWELSKLLKGRLAHVNLIPMNPIAEKPNLKRSKKDKIYSFADILKRCKIPITIRITMGDRIQAACGQLANRNKLGL